MREHEPDRQTGKAYWEPNHKADRIFCLVMIILAIVLPLIFR